MLNVAVLPVRATVPSGMFPFWNVTVPVGVPLEEVTVAVKVTDWPKLEGFKLELIVVEVGTRGTPVPDKVTVWGLAVPLSLMLKVEFIVPAFCGVKVTLMVQFAPAATVPLVLPTGMHVFVCVNDGSPVVTLVTVSGLVPVLVRVTETGTLLVPTFWLPNAMLVGDKLTVVPPGRFITSLRLDDVLL